MSDSGSDHHIVYGRSVYRSAGSAWDPSQVHRTSDHHPNRGSHRPLWFPGSRGASWKALGHSYVVSTKNSPSGITGISDNICEVTLTKTQMPVVPLFCDGGGYSAVSYSYSAAGTQ